MLLSPREMEPLYERGPDGREVMVDMDAQLDRIDRIVEGQGEEESDQRSASESPLPTTNKGERQ